RMSAPARSRLGRHALRIAAIATVLVALGLCGALTATDVLVSHNLTAAIDQRLNQWMTQAAAQPNVPVIQIDPDHDFDAPLLSWVMQPGGGCRPVGSAPALPPRARTAEGRARPRRAGGGPAPPGPCLRRRLRRRQPRRRPGGADAPAAARLHRRCLARAAHPAHGHAGGDEPGPFRQRPRSPPRPPTGQRRDRPYAPDRRGSALARPLRLPAPAAPGPAHRSGHSRPDGGGALWHVG